MKEKASEKGKEPEIEDNHAELRKQSAIVIKMADCYLNIKRY